MKMRLHKLEKFYNDTKGSVIPTVAILSVLLIGTAGVAIDYTSQTNARSKLQEVVDAAVLAGASSSGSNSKKLEVAQSFFAANIPGLTQFQDESPLAQFEITSSGTLLGRSSVDVPLLLSSVLAEGPLQVGVVAEAGFNQSANPCIIVLADDNDAAIFNGGANIDSPTCEINVHSERNPAAVFNSGVNLDVDRACIAGNNILNNGTNIENLVTGCQRAPDPFAGTIPEPIVPINCTTSNVVEGSRSIAVGRHCDVTLRNGNFTFEPGVHIITGTMIWGANVNITAQDVTFYFPDTGSRIQANGEHIIRASAPTSGDYKDILIFESTSNPTNNDNKTQYTINASNSEQIEGIIYLPNRDLVYNGGANVEAKRINYVVNKLTVNAGNLNLEPLSEANGSSIQARLIK